MATQSTRQDDEENQPLLGSADDAQMTQAQQAIGWCFQSTADLANHLPTGTLLAFHVLAPVLTDSGSCTMVNRAMTALLLALCGLSCFLLSFTDSLTDEATGRVRYGLATLGGLWMIDGQAPLPPEDTAPFRLVPVDFVHAFTSVVVFAAVALVDQNVVSCFYPLPSEEMQQLLTALPMAVGFLGCSLLIAFPTTRHGIGFPVTSSSKKSSGS